MIRFFGSIIGFVLFVATIAWLADNKSRKEPATAPSVVQAAPLVPLSRFVVDSFDWITTYETSVTVLRDQQTGDCTAIYTSPPSLVSWPVECRKTPTTPEKPTP